MPVHWTISHANRLVVAVTKDEVTVSDIEKYFAGMTADGAMAYRLSILKAQDNLGSRCQRHFFEYAAIPGQGHFIHTYQCDGDPLPSFEGEPKTVRIEGDAQALADMLWEHLNPDNKVSLYVRYTDLTTGACTQIIRNKNQ